MRTHTHVFSHMEWPHWIPERNSRFHMFNTSAPWEPLINLLSTSSLKHAPMLKLRWRTRLLHPRYPYYYQDRTASMLADHCSQEIGIRLSEDGYITADWHMDSPPMRTVLLDPYTGYVLLLYVLCV